MFDIRLKTKMSQNVKYMWKETAHNRDDLYSYACQKWYWINFRLGMRRKHSLKFCEKKMVNFLAKKQKTSSFNFVNIVTEMTFQFITNSILELRTIYGTYRYS